MKKSIKRNTMPLLKRRLYGDPDYPTRTVIELGFDEVYVVVIGSSTCRPHVITRYAPETWLDRIRPTGMPYDSGYSVFIDCCNAVYDGKTFHTTFFDINADKVPVPRMIPCLGYSTMKEEAEKYADKLYWAMQHHTNLHYPADVVGEYKHTGKHTYCRARRGLWTRHFPTWKCHLALAALRDAAEAMPLQLEFRDDTCMNCTHLDCPYSGRTDVSRCGHYRG